MEPKVEQEGVGLYMFLSFGSQDGSSEHFDEAGEECEVSELWMHNIVPVLSLQGGHWLNYGTKGKYV